MSETKIKKIILVDDHSIVREGLEKFIDGIAGLEVVEQCHTGKELLRSEKLRGSDLIILDLIMPEMDGIQVLEKLREDYPDKPVLVFTMCSGLELFNRCVGLGALGYILKSDSLNILKVAIFKVLKGSVAFSPQISQPLSNGENFDEYEKLFKLLTQRESEVVRFIAVGMTSEEIARKLKAKPSTVSSHRRNINKKIGSTSLIELCIFAKKHNLI